MTPAQRKYLDALQEMLQEGVSVVAWKVCQRAGVAVGTLSGWKAQHRAAVEAGAESQNQDFFDEERAIRQTHRDAATAARVLEPEILLPEPEEEEIPEVLVAYLSALEAGLEEADKLDRYGAFRAIQEQGWQVSFDELIDAIEGGHKKATRRFSQLKRRTTIRTEDRLRACGMTGTKSADNTVALQILRTDDPEKWNPKAKIVHEFQLEPEDRKLIEGQREWFKGHMKKIPASAAS